MEGICVFVVSVQFPDCSVSLRSIVCVVDGVDDMICNAVSFCNVSSFWCVVREYEFVTGLEVECG